MKNNLSEKNNIYSRIEPLTRLHSKLVGLVEGQLWLKVLIALFFGILLGVLLGPSAGLVEEDISSVLGKWLALPGQLFLAVIKMVVIPLVAASIIRGLFSSEDLGQLKRIGVRALLIMIVSTSFSVFIGIAFAILIRPGKFLQQSFASDVSASAGKAGASTTSVFSLETIPEKIVGLVPTNPMSSMVSNEMIQIVIFSIIVGFAMLLMEKNKSQPLLDLLGSIQEVAMTLIKWIMKFAPVAVFGLIAEVTLKTGIKSLFGMGVYVFTVLIGLAFLFIIYLAVIKIMIKKPIGEYLSNVREVLLLAFSTSSSAAVMPLTLKTVEQKLNVKSAIGQLVVPLGATMNMNGTGLYQGVATVFLAQAYSVNLSLQELIIVVISAVGASIGSPAAPGVGIAILSMILASAGIPVEGIALIIGVDRILDMARTVINVMGDIFTCSFLDRYS